MKFITSPFSDELLPVKLRKETITFRGKQFEVNYHFYEDTEQQFTTDETDEVNLRQVYEQYEKSK
jgi:hypothetical protein